MGLALVRYATATEEQALLGLLAWLKQRGYRFVTITPASHERVISRPGCERATDLADIFGWSLPFARDLLPAGLFDSLEAAGCVAAMDNRLYRSQVRVSSLGADLFVHSAFPTDEADAVFFGPDSYRFADFIGRELERRSGKWIGSVVDIGTGSGVGGIAAGRSRPQAKLAGTDVNARALAFAEVNAEAAGLPLRLERADTLEALGGPWDLILANPPYMIDASARAYRDGGDALGAEASLAMTRDAVRHLAPDGVFLLYTGSAIVRGHDGLQEELAGIAEAEGLKLDYRELDPDVFGEELETAPYRDVDRIAVVGAVFERIT